MKIHKTNIFTNFIFGLVLILFQCLKSQSLDLELGKEFEYIADLEKFFRIDVTEAAKHKNIIFHVSPVDNYENWSDPDIYISKKNSFPSAYNYDWLSNRVGDDILIISTKEIKDTDILYAGVKCMRKCAFKVKAFFEDEEITIQENQEIVFQFQDNSESERILNFYPLKNDNKFYEVHVKALNLVDFDFTVSLKKKHSQQNLDLNAWFGGYSVFLEPKFLTQTNGCTGSDCFYRIVISAKPGSLIIITVVEAFTTRDLSLNKIYRKSLLPEKFDCFYINRTIISEDEILKDTDKLIFHASSYTQDVGLVILPDSKKLKDNNPNDGRIQHIFKEEINFQMKFADALNKYLCIYPNVDRFTSYQLFVYKESESENIQKMNFLTNGVSSTGFLPANKTTSYKNFDNSLNATSLSLNLLVKEGNPVLYAYTCLNVNDCFFTSENLIQFRPNLISTTKINDEYSIKIPVEENPCKKLKDQGHPAARLCAIVSIVNCQGDKECSFIISMHYNDGTYLLKEKIKHTKFIKKDDFDYYKILNTDPASNKLSIILHSHTGDADLYVSRKFYKNPQDDPEALYSASSSGNRDYIDIYDKIKNINEPGYNSTLQGEYYIAVLGFRNSFYSITYSLSQDYNKVTDGGYLTETGIMHSSVDVAGETKHYRFSNRNRGERRPFIITAVSLNCAGKLKATKYEKGGNIDSSFPVISSPPNEKTSHNQIFINPTSAIYDVEFYSVSYESVKLENQNDSNLACLYYLSGNSLDKELMLNEGVPHILTFNPKDDFVKFAYVYAHISADKNPCLIDIFFESKSVSFQVIISFEANQPMNKTDTGKKNLNTIVTQKEVLLYDLISPQNILIPSSTLSKNCENNFSCNIHIEVSLSGYSNVESTINDDSFTYKITARSNSLIPSYLKKGNVKHDYVLPNNYQYYYTNIKKNEAGQIILSSKSGTGILVGRIVKKNQPKEPNADYGNVVLPTIFNSDLKYNKKANCLTFGVAETAMCEEGCEIYFGVYSENREKYKDTVNDFSILISTGNINLNINEHFNGILDSTSKGLQYFTLEVPENLFHRIGIILSFSSFYKGKLLVNVGDINQAVELPTPSGSSYFVSDQIKSQSNFDFTLNKKAKKFVIGVFANVTEYANVTDVIPYEIYAADTSYINSQNLFEIKVGDTLHCTTHFENSYCDFLMILPDTETVIFHTQFLKEYFSNYEEHFMDSVILANLYNNTEYNKLLQNENLRPRKHTNPMYQSGVNDDAIQEYNIFPDNNILIFKNPYKNPKGNINANTNNNSNFNIKNFTQTILCVSVFVQKAGTFRFLSNKIIPSLSVLTLSNQHNYLFYINPSDSLEVKAPHYLYRGLDEKTSLLEKDAINQQSKAFTNIIYQNTGKESNTISISTVLGEATLLFKNKVYKINPQSRNMKVILNENSAETIKLNVLNHKKEGKALPYICVISLKNAYYKQELVLGESFDVLFPSLSYPKSFYFTAYNNTYGNIAADIDVTFNFKVLEYQGLRPSQALGKNKDFKLKSHITQDLYTLHDSDSIHYNLGEYDPVNNIGMISSQLHKSKSYILNYEITLKGDKIDENIQSYDFNNRENTADYLLMRISFNSDNFKYSKSSLPYKTYYYSSINTERIYDSSKTEKKIYHIHRLSRKNLLDNFFFIELASCGNEFSYALRDFNKFNDVKDEDFFLNKTDLKHEYKFHHGKKIIEVELKDNSRDLLLIVFPLKLNEKNVCQEINTKTYCDYSYYSDYVIRYRTSKSRIDLEKYKLDKEGLITLKYNITNDSPTDFTLNWGSVLERNDRYEYEAVANSIMRVMFFDANKIQNSELNSICHFESKNALAEYFELENFHRGYDSFNYKVEKSINYQIVLVAETLDDNTYLAYIPTYVYIKIGSYSIGLIFLLIFMILLLLFITFLIYRKYRLTKKRLDYEINDIRNMANLPNDTSISQINMIGVGDSNTTPAKNNSSDRKYITLTESK